MGQSLVQNYIHIVFSTKHREPLITPKIETKLHEYIGGICNNLDCQVLIVGGYTDHIHILCLLSKKICISDLLEKVKANSSKWAKTQGQEFYNFYWQNGYGAFSISPKHVEAVIQYIKNQHEHHSKQTFQTEFRSILKKYKVKYEEKYVWD